jgi:hypothetical protein
LSEASGSEGTASRGQRLPSALKLSLGSFESLVQLVHRIKKYLFEWNKSRMARIFLDVETFRVRRSAQLEGEASSPIVYRRVPDICSVAAAFVPLARIGKMEVQEMNHGLFTHSARSGYKTHTSGRTPH